MWFNSGDDFGTGDFMDATINDDGEIMILFHRNSDDTGNDRRVMFAFGTLGGGCTPIPEICDNGVDDDCDGNVDCDDGDCACDAACDMTAPMIACPADITVNSDPGQCGAVVNYTTPAGTDECPGATTFRTTGLGSGALFPVGTTTETYEVMDAAGNTAMCSFTVTVLDTEAPLLSCPANITVNNDPGQCGAVVNYTAPVGTDNCPGVTTTLVTGLGSGATFPVGTTTEAYHATDAAGLTTSCGLTVTVIDAEAPVIDCSGIIPNRSADPGMCSFTMPGAGFDPAANDNCGATLTNDFNNTASLAGETFPVGTTMVTWTATDAAGNSASCSIDIVITDDEDPTIMCPGDILNVEPTGPNGATVDYTAPVAGVDTSDNCPGETVAQTAGLGSGALFPIGMTSETYTVTDAAGNTSSCTFVVEVLTPTQVAQTLIEEVEQLVDDGVLTADQGAGLLDKLHEIIAKIEAGKSSACNQIRAFINQVNAFVNARRLSPEQADELISSATNMSAALGCNGVTANNPERPGR